MARELWFGTKQNFQWMPMPSSGIQRRNVFSSESGTLDRGGAYSSRSRGSHQEYDFSFGVREATGVSGLNAYQEYATGLWDDYSTLVNGFNPNDMIYFADPMTMRQNVFPPHWASPMLGLSGDWPAIGTNIVGSATPANIYRQPQTSVSFDITAPINTLPTALSQQLVIPIPRGHTLHYGWSGSTTGSGVLRNFRHNWSTGAIVSVGSTPTSNTGAARTTSTIDGDTYDYATFGFARTSTTGTTNITLTSMLAQIWPNTITPTITGNHIAGLGNSGCAIDGDLVEDYIQADDSGNRRLKSLSFGLIEVGAWLP